MEAYNALKKQRYDAVRCYIVDGDSDAMIVRGLIAILKAMYTGLTLREVMQVDAPAELGRLGLNDHLSAQRSNGLRAMVERIRLIAAQQGA